MPTEESNFHLTTEAARLRRKILAAVIGIGMFITLASCGIIVLAFFERLQDAEKAELRQEILIRKLSLAQFAGRARTIADLVSSRTGARLLTEGFLNGSVSKDEMTDGLNKILADAIASSEELIGVIRFNPSGIPIFAIGETSSIDDLPDGFNQSDKTTIHGPFMAGGRRWLAVNAPITNKEGEKFGTDVVFVKDGELADLLRDDGSLIGVVDLTLGRMENGQIHLLRQVAGKPSLHYDVVDVTQAGFLIEALQGSEGMAAGKSKGRDKSLLVGYSPVPESPWGLLISVDQKEIYSDLYDRIGVVFGAVLGLIAVGGIWLYRMMDPLAAGIVVEAENLEKEVARQTSEIRRKNKELAQVVYVASHDLRSPLVNAQGFSTELEAALNEIYEILETSEVPDTVRAKLAPALKEDAPEALRFILTSIEKMDMLLKGLLRISRLGRAALNTTPLDINEMLEKVRDTFERQIRSEGASVLIAELLPGAQGDSTQINQVFSNLLGNALKYRHPDRPPLIEIGGGVVAGEAVYSFKDNGIGVPAEHREKAFELYHRLNPRSAVEGEGLGLTIVRTILDRHDGRIWVESEEGVGSTFFVALPLAKDEFRAI